jgi:transposase
MTEEETMRGLFVGMDASKDDLKAAVKDDRNTLVMPIKTYRHDQASFEALVNDIELLEREFGCRAIFGMEATGIYHVSLYRFLQEKGKQTKVFNGLEIKRFKGRIRKTKTDKLDAVAISEALILSVEPIYKPPSDFETVHLRELTRMRGRIVKKMSICKNQGTRSLDILCRGYSGMFKDTFSPSSVAIIKGTFRLTHLFGMSTEQMATVLSEFMPQKAAQEKASELSALFGRVVVPEKERDSSILELHLVLQQLELLNEQLDRIERRIEETVKKTNTKLTTIPGIGELTAGILIGELGSLKQFRSASQLIAFAGLDVVVKQSGHYEHLGHISKRGSPNLREALYKAALPASQYNPVCKPFYEKLRNKGKHHKVALVAVARKLLHIAYSVETKNREFYVPNHTAIKAS